MANLVWGIESRVLLPDGTAVPGFEAAAETQAVLRAAGAAVPGSAAEPVAPLRYRLASVRAGELDPVRRGTHRRLDPGRAAAAGRPAPGEHDP